MKYESKKAVSRLHITDRAGQPLSKQKLHLKLKNHEFLFGCGAFDFMSYVDEKNDFYQERVDKWLDLYNYGTMAFYWGKYEPTEGDPQQDNRMNASRVLVENGIKVKGHPLCWHTACADWLMNYDNKTILDKQLKRIDRDVSAFKGVIDMWDVINEVVIMPEFDKYDNAITRICQEYGRVPLVKEVFQAAKTANPDAVLLINDFNLSEKYVELIDGCLEAGVPISAIGLQTHQHQGYMGEEKLAEILKRYEKFGLPLHFTENTLVSGHIMPGHIVDLNDYQIPEWPSTPEGEERQAREMESMYRLLFDHPLVEAITGWDFTDGMWLGAPSGVIRCDNSAKPSYHMLQNLIQNEWHTEYDIVTDENGNAEVYGYKGSYELSAGEASAVFQLTAGVKEQAVVI